MFRTNEKPNNAELLMMHELQNKTWRERFPLETEVEEQWQKFPSLGKVKFLSGIERDVFSSAISDDPFVAEFANFCSAVKHTVPAEPLVLGEGDGLLRKGRVWVADWLALPTLTSVASFSVMKRRGEWIVWSPEPRSLRRSMPSHWNVRRF